MDTPLNGVIFVCGSMIFSTLGLFLVRRHLNIEWLKRQHEVASFFFLMIGTLYAVLIAFGIFVVWSQFQDAGTNLEREANEVGDLSRMSMVMPEPVLLTILLAMNPAISPRMIQLSMPTSNLPRAARRLRECAVWTGKTQAGTLGRHIFAKRRQSNDGGAAFLTRPYSLRRRQQWVRLTMR